MKESEYYERIKLLVGGKFVEIVKIGETIADGLNGKIARVSFSLVSSRLLKKKKTCQLFFMRGRRPLEYHHRTRSFSTFTESTLGLLYVSLLSKGSPSMIPK